MKVKDYPESGVMTPFQAVFKQAEGICMPRTVLIPHLHLVDRQPNVVEADRIDEADVFLREEGSSFLATAFTLREPVRDVRAAVDFKGAIFFRRHHVAFGSACIQQE